MNWLDLYEKLVETEIPEDPQSTEFMMYILYNVPEELQDEAREFADNDPQIDKWGEERKARKIEKGWQSIMGATDEYMSDRSEWIGDRHLVLFNQYIHDHLKKDKP